MSDTNTEKVRRFMQEQDCRFICPDCGGAFWSTRYTGQPNEQGYCKTEGCRFTWPRDNDGEVFYRLTKVNDALLSAVE